MSAESSSLPEVGTVVGRYVILEHRGSGSMGEVLLAEDRMLGRKVAVKLLRQEHLARPDLRARFEREARSVAAINHPNVVQIFDTDSWEGRPFFVMEYLSGVDVAQLLDSAGRLEQGIAASIGVGAALGLAEAAAAGVVHRDVKPANLVVTERGQVKVTDFGLAKAARPFDGSADLTLQGSTLGTPDYIPPEQARGEEVDSRADVYGLGCTLFHLFAGRPPFRYLDENCTYMDVVARHVTSPPPLLELEAPEVAPELAQLVLRMMAKEPARRPGYDEVVEILTPFATALPTGSALYAPAPHPVRPKTDAVVSTPTLVQGPRRGLLPLATGDLRPGPAALEVPRPLPGWAVALTVVSVLCALGAAGLYLFLPGN